MKKLFSKKTTLALIISIVLVVAVSLTVLAVSFDVFDFSGDGNVGNEDVELFMENIVGDKLSSDLSRYNLTGDANNDVNILDVIALKRYILNIQSISDGWTVGIY